MLINLKYSCICFLVLVIYFQNSESVPAKVQHVLNKIPSFKTSRHGSDKSDNRRSRDDERVGRRRYILDKPGRRNIENGEDLPPGAQFRNVRANSPELAAAATGNDDDGTLFVPAKEKQSEGDKKEEGENDGEKGETTQPNDNNDSEVVQDPATEEEKMDDMGKTFQKYHAERITFVQDNIATNWPLGIVPYFFDTNSFDHILASRVREAMDYLESVSCVQFKPLVVPPAMNFTWVFITNPEKQRECSHFAPKMRSGSIRLILGLDCLKRRDILHSLLHAIGFKDEVTHPHRDSYVRVAWDNIQPRYQHLFGLDLSSRGQADVEYDPMSIMHFHDRAFSKNGHATIVPLMPGLQIQPSDKLSQLDKMRLRLGFGHECNRRSVDDLLDTCKNVLHNDEKDRNVKAKKLKMDTKSSELGLGKVAAEEPNGNPAEEGVNGEAVEAKTADKEEDNATLAAQDLNRNVPVEVKEEAVNEEVKEEAAAPNEEVKEEEAIPANEEAKEEKAEDKEVEKEANKEGE